MRLNWRQKEVPELDSDDMLSAYEKGAMRFDELRKMLTKAGCELMNPENEAGPSAVSKP